MTATTQRDTAQRGARHLRERLRGNRAGDRLAAGSKAALRAYGTATAAHRPPPELLIVGAKRGGTTSLWQYLSEHPGLLGQFPTPNSKGTYFLSEEWHRGERWWRSHFASRRVRTRAQARLGYAPVAGESSPYDLYHPLAPQRAAQVAPDALIVAVLRHPVDRAFSHWKERRRHTETLEFADAIDAEAERIAGEAERIVADPSYVSFPHRHQSYLDQGRYAPMLERWFAAYGRDGVLVETAEAFYADPQALVDSVTDRLGLPRRAVADTSPRNDAPSDPMSADLRARLTAELAPDIAAVEQLLGRDTGWT
ncbi:MAG: sulfotransferase [Microthrixaceae bacterium]